MTTLMTQTPVPLRITGHSFDLEEALNEGETVFHCRTCSFRATWTRVLTPELPRECPTPLWSKP